MRIKLRCPHCGDWFTLNLGIENGEVETRESDEQAEEADADGEPARPRAPASRGRLIGAVCVIAAALIVTWAVAALRSDRGVETGAPDEVSARPAAVEVGSDGDREGPGEGGAPGGLSAEGAESEPEALTDEAPPERNEVVVGEDEAPAEAVVGEDEAPAEAADSEEQVAAADGTSADDDDPADVEPGPGEAASSGSAEIEAAPADLEPPEPASGAARGREILELEIEALSRCWILVKADGVVVADATLEEGERRSWRADGFFELNLGAGDAVRLSLNGSDLGPAGPDARVVDGLRVTRDGIRGR
jgi:hypothetical protein